MQSKATTVSEYLAGLPADRREAIGAVRAVILKNLDKGYEEGMQYGMIGYYVPHRIFPAGYHCDPKQPLPFAGLASQKNHMALYLMGVYCGYDVPSDCDGPPASGDWFRTAWARTGKKLDMGKCCVRFKKLEDVALEVVGESIRRAPAREYVEWYLASLARSKGGAGRPAAKAKSRPSPGVKKKAGKSVAGGGAAKKKAAGGPAKKTAKKAAAKRKA